MDKVKYVKEWTWNVVCLHLYNVFLHFTLIGHYYPSLLPLTQDGATPLYAASGKGHSDIVDILIRNGADVNLATNVWRYNVPYTHTV